MRIGFVYILLNPAFPRRVKIGRTSRDVKRRAGELSRQTGVPDDFVILYDEIVSDAEEVERLLHEKFGEYRTKSNKEFFDIPPREVIKALQQLARDFPAIPFQDGPAYDLMPHLAEHFSKYLDPKVTAIRFLQLPGVSYLEVTRQSRTGIRKVVTHEELPLSGLVVSPSLEAASFDLARNVELLRTLDAYDWIMIADIIPSDIAKQIAQRWEEKHPVRATPRSTPVE